jgi:hypothetical protein
MISPALRMKGSPGAKAFTCAPVRAAITSPIASCHRLLPLPFRPMVRMFPFAPKSDGIEVFLRSCFRLHGTATEAYGRLSLPRRLGTPGMANSRMWVTRSSHLQRQAFADSPRRRQPVVVTAMATDPQQVTSLNVRYRESIPIRPIPNIAMRDDGQAGDAIRETEFSAPRCRHVQRVNGGVLCGRTRQPERHRHFSQAGVPAAGF